MARYAVGIDLGTTNSAVAFAELREGATRARMFDVPQPAAAPDGPRLSPVAASARVLEHIAAVWAHRHGTRLAAEDVVLTVPASFDEVARELTVLAARKAGVAPGTLLEEPPGRGRPEGRGRPGDAPGGAPGGLLRRDRHPRRARPARGAPPGRAGAG